MEQPITDRTKAAARTTIPVKDGNAGLIPTWINAGTTITTKTVSTFVGLTQDVRTEARTVATATIDCLEIWVTSVFRLGRKVTERLDSLATDAVGSGEQAALVTLGTLELVGESAVALASTTTASVVGARAAS